MFFEGYTSKGMDTLCAFLYIRALTHAPIVCPGSSGVEQRIENPRVGGSIPPPGTILIHP